jgi:hypothetical protein
MCSGARTALLAAGLLLSACEQPSAPIEPQTRSRPSVRPVAARADLPNISEEQRRLALLELEHAYSQALIKRDRAFLQSYYAQDWRGGNWLGFWTKATMLKAVLGARYEVRSMKLQDLQARVFGNVGIVQGVSNEVTRVDGRDTSGRWTFTDVFAWRDGRWVAVASQTAEVKAQ